MISPLATQPMPSMASLKEKMESWGDKEVAAACYMVGALNEALTEGAEDIHRNQCVELCWTLDWGIRAYAAMSDRPAPTASYVWEAAE